MEILDTTTITVNSELLGVAEAFFTLFTWSAVTSFILSFVFAWRNNWSEGMFGIILTGIFVFLVCVCVLCNNRGRETEGNRLNGT